MRRQGKETRGDLVRWFNQRNSFMNGTLAVTSDLGSVLQGNERTQLNSPDAHRPAELVTHVQRTSDKIGDKRRHYRHNMESKTDLLRTREITKEENAIQPYLFTSNHIRTVNSWPTKLNQCTEMAAMYCWYKHEYTLLINWKHNPRFLIFC